MSFAFFPTPPIAKPPAPRTRTITCEGCGWTGESVGPVEARTLPAHRILRVERCPGCNRKAPWAPAYLLQPETEATG